MPNGFERFLKKLQQAATRRTGQRGFRRTRARGPARATGRALALTGRPGRPGGFGIRVHAVKPRKAKKAR